MTTTNAASMATTAEGTQPGAFGVKEWQLWLAVGCIWGSSFFFIGVALDDGKGFRPMLITWLRVALGCATLFLFPSARQRVERPDWPRIAFLGLSWMAFPLSMFPLAEERVSSAVTGLLNAGTPLSAALVASVLLRRLPGVAQRRGLGLATAGMVLTALPSISEGSSQAAGVFMILAALASYGVSLNIVVPLTQKYGSLPVLARAAAVATVVLAPFGMTAMASSRFEWRYALANGALGVFGSALAFVAMATLAGRVGSTRAASATYFMPVVALLLGVFLLDDHVSWPALVGSAVMLAGAWMMSRAGR